MNLLRELVRKVSSFAAGNTLVERLEGGGYGVRCCASRVANGPVSDDLVFYAPEKLGILQDAAPFVIGPCSRHTVPAWASAKTVREAKGLELVKLGSESTRSRKGLFEPHALVVSEQEYVRREVAYSSLA
jgi:hypothetical protein